MIKVKVEFLGGLNIILAPPHPREVTVSIEDESTVLELIKLICNDYIPDKENIQVFIENGTIRPGILTLINDTDWELEGEESYVLENKDVISFTSTLHGG